MFKKILTMNLKRVFLVFRKNVMFLRLSWPYLTFQKWICQKHNILDFLQILEFWMFIEIVEYFFIIIYLIFRNIN